MLFKYLQAERPWMQIHFAKVNLKRKLAWSYNLIVFPVQPVYQRMQNNRHLLEYSVTLD